MAVLRALFPPAQLLTAKDVHGTRCYGFSYVSDATSVLDLQFLVPREYVAPAVGEASVWQPDGPCTVGQWKGFVAGYRAARGEYELYRLQSVRSWPTPPVGRSFEEHFEAPPRATLSADVYARVLPPLDDGWVELTDLSGREIGGCVLGHWGERAAPYHGEIWQLNDPASTPSTFMAVSREGSVAEGLDALDRQARRADSRRAVRVAMLFTRELMGTP